MQSNAEKLRCAVCDRKFRFEELGGITASSDDRCYLDCPECGARNELRAEPKPGLGTQPAAVIVSVRESTTDP